ncbi:MAG TPA: DUF2207 domain-containing protein [Vicinamibacterales bacterium]|nr:DUF2207 domain-containing protein [Vicinamibacterales bacterium]
MSRAHTDSRRAQVCARPRPGIAPGTLLIAALLVWAAAPAAAKTYSAERFDSTIRVRPGGDIEVSETVVFRFETGTFEHVFREIPTRRTDGIDVLGASMDGRALAFGTGRGQVEVTRRSRVRVQWRFDPTSSSSHTFTVTYLARGTVHREGGVDLLWWRALPSEHAYAIHASTIVVEHPGVRVGEPRVETRRAPDPAIDVQDNRIRVSTAAIRRNGWLELRVPFEAGSVIAQAPLWQQKQARQAALGPSWMAAGGLVFVAGLVWLFALRQQYPAPDRRVRTAPVFEPPDDLQPALAGALAANGRVQLEHAMAALVGLADRRQLAITEEPKGTLRQRRFTLRRLRNTGPLAPHEEGLLDTVFDRMSDDPEQVTLSKARSRITRRFRRFRADVRRELTARGLIHEDRQRIKDRYGRVSLAMLVTASAGLLAAGLLVPRFGPWPLFVPGALVAAAVIGFIVQGATTPLSDEGLHHAEAWREFGRHLKDVAHSRVRAAPDISTSLLGIAIALGLASAWSKFLKHQPAAAPPWFQSVSSADDGGFPAFVAVWGASSSGGGAGAAGGAAGGGASGAG